MRSINNLIRKMEKGEAKALRDLVGLVGADEIARAYVDGVEDNIRSFQKWNKFLVIGFVRRNLLFVRDVLRKDADRYACGDIHMLMRMATNFNYFMTDRSDIEKLMTSMKVENTPAIYVTGLIALEYLTRMLHDGKTSINSIYNVGETKEMDGDDPQGGDSIDDRE